MIHVREWVFVLFVFLVVMTVVVQSNGQGEFTTNNTNMIEVNVLGAVESEKKVMLSSNATMADLLAKVALAEDAAIEKIYMQEPIKTSTVIIPKKGCVSVLVQGEVVAPGLYSFAEGTRFSEIAASLQLLEGADKKVFQRKKRSLCDGEQIVVAKIK